VWFSCLIVSLNEEGMFPCRKREVLLYHVEGGIKYGKVKKFLCIGKEVGQLTSPPPQDKSK
jgi:hypothetical protein